MSRGTAVHAVVGLDTAPWAAVMMLEHMSDDD